MEGLLFTSASNNISYHPQNCVQGRDPIKKLRGKEMINSLLKITS